MVRTSKLVTMLAAFGLLSVACSKDDTVARRLSQQNESCQSSGDCAGSLLCVSLRCTAGDVAVNPESKQCSLIACSVSADCCTPVATAEECTTLNTACTAAADPTTSTDCLLYNAECCPQTAIDKFACNNGVCQNKCTTDTDCTTGLLTHCSGDTCVRCLVDTDCPANNTCATDTHSCVPSCKTDGQCPALQHCVSSRCSFVGCANDRECVAYTLDPTTSCNSTTHLCTAKCNSDADCLKNQVVQTGLTYAYQVCSNGNCQNAGCQSDDECKDLLKTRISATVAAVCTAPAATP